jgi:cytoplasmic tRNA 2-thiolation protein 1
MAPSPCALCHTNRALILRPKDHSKLCKTCFITVFETEIHHTITANALFTRGERVAIGASGGKDSTVLASVLKTLNERYDYGLDLILLSIDEGIKGYRDDSLETVKRNAEQYEMDLTILGYAELYGWTMDQVVEQVGKKGNCTYCGVFRRQALDRGAARLGVKHVVTGHNADDVAETVLMNCRCIYIYKVTLRKADWSSVERRSPPPVANHIDHHIHALRGQRPRLKHEHKAQQTAQVRIREGNRPLRTPQIPRLL